MAAPIKGSPFFLCLIFLKQRWQLNHLKITGDYLNKAAESYHGLTDPSFLKPKL